MSRKSKGIGAERELVHKFWDNGWACIRVAGSGSSKYPSPDLIAGNNIRKVAIEVKTTKDDSKYFPEQEIEQLKQFASIFGAEPWIAVKFGKNWYFINPEDLKETKQFNLSIKKSDVELRGLSFEELINFI